MTLRDEHGEVEVGIGDLFKIKEATFSVICPEFTTGINPTVWVRLHAGVFLLPDGRRFEIQPDIKAPVFLFTGELVASCMREHRLMTFDIPETPQTPAEKLAKASRARTSKKRTPQDQPTTDTLF